MHRVLEDGLYEERVGWSRWVLGPRRSTRGRFHLTRGQVLLLAAFFLGHSVLQYFGLLGRGFVMDIATVFGLALCVVIPARIFQTVAWNRRVKRSARNGPRDIDEAVMLRASLAEAVCACCGYSLGDVKPGESGLMCCTECGAAWDLDVWRADDPELREPAWYADRRHCRHATVRDGRKRVVRFLATVPIERQDELTRPFFRWVRLNRVVMLVATVGIAAVIAGYLRMQPQPPGLVVAALMGLLIPLYMTVPVWIFLLIDGTKAKRRDAARQLTSMGKCACCLGQLRAGASPVDGCWLCDACGAAWDGVEDEKVR